MFRTFLSSLFGFSILCQLAVAGEIICPVAPKQYEKDVSLDIEASASTIAKIANGRVRGSLKQSVNNFYDKFPNVDKIYLSQMIASTTCEIIKASSQLSDREKLDRWQSFSRDILGSPQDAPRIKPKKDSSLNEQRSPSKQVLELIEVDAFNDKNIASHRIVFDGRKTNLHNVDFLSKPTVRIAFACDNYRYIRDFVPSISAGFHGFNASEQYIIINEGVLIKVISEWIQMALVRIREVEDKKCSTTAYFTNYYEFSFSDLKDKDYKLFYRASYNFDSSDQDILYFSTASKGAWAQNLQTYENALKSGAIDFTDKSLANWKLVFNLAKKKSERNWPF